MVCLIIPALNEADVIGEVACSIPGGAIDEIIVVDNGSTDQTSTEAELAGAKVIRELPRGYGRACRAGMNAALAAGAQVIVFMDGDGSDCPEFIPQIVQPVLSGAYDFVIGSSIRGNRERGSMNASQLLAGRLAGWLLYGVYGVRFTGKRHFAIVQRIKQTFTKPCSTLRNKIEMLGNRAGKLRFGSDGSIDGYSRSARRRSTD